MSGFEEIEAIVAALLGVDLCGGDPDVLHVSRNDPQLAVHFINIAAHVTFHRAEFVYLRDAQSKTRFVRERLLDAYNNLREAVENKIEQLEGQS